MKDIFFIVYGNPKPQKRHRSARTGSSIRQYDPSAHDKSNFLLACINNRPKQLIEGAIEIQATFNFQRPKSHFKSGKYSSQLKENAPYHHTSKPDGDNLVKFVMDSLNGIFWKDDSQIAKISIVKIYSELPRTEISIKELQEQDF